MDAPLYVERSRVVRELRFIVIYFWPVSSSLSKLNWRNKGESTLAWGRENKTRDVGIMVLCYNKLMLNRMILLASLVSIIFIMVILNFTTPAGIGPFGVLIFFAMVYVVMFGIATVLVGMFSKAMGKKDGISRKGYYYAVMLAFGPMLLLLVQAIGGINIPTIGLVTSFVLLGCFLIKKRLEGVS